MKKFVITCTSTCDMTSYYLRKHNMYYVSFYYYLNEERFYDDFFSKVSVEEFYTKLKSYNSRTSQPDPEQYRDLWNKLINQGYDILHIELSSGISGAINSALIAKSMVEETNKDAKIYADGGVVDGLAGGICQISSTLYNAAVMANLEIVERRNHSYPTSYLPVGKDATVVSGVLDLKFKNTRKYPIKITSSVKNGVASFTVHGIKDFEDVTKLRILR